MKKRLLQVLEIVLLLALVGFIVWQAEHFFAQVEWWRVPRAWGWIIASSVLFFLGYVVMSYHWLRVCRLIDPSANKRQILAFFASQPYKYLPTSLFTLSYRAKFAKRAGLDLRASSQAQFIENANMVTSALLLGGGILLFIHNFLLAMVALGAGILVMLLLWRLHTMTLPKIKLQINFRKLIPAFFVSMVGWGLMGLGFFVIAYGLEHSHAIFLSISASSLATSFGMIAVFAPGGIGVRELVFASLGFAGSTIIMWRFVTFVNDIVLGAISAWQLRQHRPRA